MNDIYNVLVYTKGEIIYLQEGGSSLEEDDYDSYVDYTIYDIADTSNEKDGGIWLYNSSNDSTDLFKQISKLIYDYNGDKSFLVLETNTDLF